MRRGGVRGGDAQELNPTQGGAIFRRDKRGRIDLSMIIPHASLDIKEWPGRLAR
jgi:hypothetical protein